MDTLIWYTGPQHNSWSGCLAFLFSITEPANSSLYFDAQCLLKLTEWFTYIGLFYRHIWSIWHCTATSKYLMSWYHGIFKNCLVMLLIITFSIRFVKKNMFPRHLDSYKTLLLNYWSTPIITICCFMHYDCNNHLRMNFFWSNQSMSRILSTTLFNTRDLSHCSAWAKCFDWPMQLCTK